MLMEETTESAINVALISSSEEESGWTFYLEDFIPSQKKELQEQKKTSSMVSDAAINPERRATLKEVPSESYKGLIFKKRKAMGISSIDDEDPLEDTATSPANSPKVGEIEDHMNMINRKKDDMRSVCEEKGFDLERCAEGKGDDDELSIVGSTGKVTELKKKGLCLVPLSMFVDFCKR